MGKKPIGQWFINVLVFLLKIIREADNGPYNPRERKQ
jgi:hypothetical protein